MPSFKTQFECLVPIIFLLSIVAPVAGFSVEPDAEVINLLENYRIDESDQPVRDFPGWQPPRHVVMFVPSFVEAIRPDYKQWIQEAVGDARVTFSAELSDLRAAAVDAEVVLGRCQAITEASTSLRWFHRYGSGMEACLRNPALQDEAVLLTNGAGLDGPYMSEHVIAMTMMLSHRMHQYYINQLNRTWDRTPDFLASIKPIHGKNMLVVGLGGIGTHIAQRAAALGMKVTATRRSSREGPSYVDYVGLSHELLALAAEADFVVSAVPLTQETVGLYDEEFFRVMKDTAYFINVARGRSVVTEDLVSALQAGEIAGAGLDVTDPDPLPDSHPLWAMPNVLITPHTSNRSGIGSIDRIILVRENLRRYAAGEPMLNVVNRSLGY